MDVQFAIKVLEQGYWGLLHSTQLQGDGIFRSSLENMHWNEKFQLRILIPKRQSEH